MSECNDEAISEIRKVRGRISAEFGHDPERLIAHSLEMQKQYQERIVNSSALAQP